MTRRPGRAGPAGPVGRARSKGMNAGRTGLIAIGASVLGTFAVAVAGPSVMEPVLPGRPGQPPWSLGRISAVARRNGLLYAAANARGMQGYAVGR